MELRDINGDIALRIEGDRCYDRNGTYVYAKNGDYLCDANGYWLYVIRGDKVYDTQGNWVYAVTHSSLHSPLPIAPEPVFCRSCGERLPSGSTFCTRCSLNPADRAVEPYHHIAQPEIPVMQPLQGHAHHAAAPPVKQPNQHMRGGGIHTRSPGAKKSGGSRIKLVLIAATLVGVIALVLVVALQGGRPGGERSSGTSDLIGEWQATERYRTLVFNRNGTGRLFFDDEVEEVSREITWSTRNGILTVTLERDAYFGWGWTEVVRYTIQGSMLFMELMDESPDDELYIASPWRRVN